MSGLNDFLYWVADSKSPPWASLLVRILLFVLMFGVMAVIFMAIFNGYGWLVFGVWVAIPSYALLEGYRRSQK